MKRFLAGLLVLAILCIAPSQSFSFVLGVDYSETVTDLGINAPGYNYVSEVEFTNGGIGWFQTETWGHSLSENYMTVPDDFIISSATLQIVGWRYAGFGNDLVQVGGTIRWTGFDGWRCVAGTDNMLDITNIDYSYWNSDPLNVSMTPVFDLGLNLTSSTLSVDYDVAGSEPNAAVPEPTTLLMFSLGIAAVGMRFRRR